MKKIASSTDMVHPHMYRLNPPIWESSNISLQIIVGFLGFATWGCHLQISRNNQITPIF